MSQNVADRHKAENEVIFRKHNEYIQKGLDELKRLAEEDGQEHMIPETDNVTLQFYCECSDENCRLRIPLEAKEYTEIHKNRHQFIIVPGHESPTVEQVKAEEDNYSVVEKYIIPRVNDVSFHALNTTDTNNV